MGSLTDSSNKIIYEMHQYLDQYASGGEPPSCVSSTIGSQRLVSATNWLRTNGKTGIIGEFAGGLDSTCEAAVSDMLSYMQSNTDVWMGAIWWAAVSGGKATTTCYISTDLCVGPLVGRQMVQR